MTTTHFDYIIVGAGTAGCLLANRLSADASKQVLLIEAGPTDRYHWIHIPVGYLYCIGNPKVDWCFQTAAEPGLNGRRLRYPRGKALGGCSSINGMIYMRGQARDYDHWADVVGDDSWRWERVLPLFKSHEDYHLGASKNHGSGGEWRVERARVRWDVLDAFEVAANQAGIPSTPDFNQGDNTGVGYFEVNQRRGWRWNTAKAFLNKTVRQRPNLTVWTHSQATRIVLAQQPDQPLRAVGVEVLRQERGAAKKVTAHARLEVVMTAGAIGTPHLMQVSGLGPANLLHSQGVVVRADLPGVGANLQDHLQIRSVYTLQGAKTLNTLASSWWGKTKIALEYALKRSGPMSMAPSQLGAFTKSDASQPYANLEYHIQPLSLDAFGEPLHTFPAMTASVCNLNPTSRGQVSIASPDIAQPPVIAPNYLSTEADQRVAAQSLRVTRHIMAQSGMARYQPVEYKPGVQYQTDDELTRLAGDIASTIFHPVGTTKMGITEGPNADAMTVVNARLQVRGVAGLRIADAGIMPTITSGNTNSPTLMIAEKAAHLMQEDARQGRSGRDA
jgi:choline dehydrogenase